VNGDRIRDLVGQLAANLASVGRGEDDFLVDRSWAEDLIAAMFHPDDHERVDVDGFSETY